MKTIETNNSNSNSTNDLYCGMVLQSDVTKSKPLQDIHKLFGPAAAVPALQAAISLTDDFLITVDTMPNEQSRLLLSLHDVISREKEMLEHDIGQLKEIGFINSQPA